MKKKWWLVGMVVIILIGGVGVFTFNQNEKQRKEQQVIKMETITAQQMKQTFADVTEIKFSEDYVENELAGFVSIDVTISTRYGVIGNIGASMSLHDKAKTLESYAGGTEFKEGITENEIKVIFSNKLEKEL